MSPVAYQAFTADDNVLSTSHALSFDSHFVDSGAMPPGMFVVVPGTSRDYPVDAIPVACTFGKEPTRSAPPRQVALSLFDSTSDQAQKCFISQRYGNTADHLVSF